MKRYGILLLSVILLILVTPSRTFADVEDSGESQKRFSFGFDHRARFASSDNALDFNDAMDDRGEYFRFRTRLWSQLDISSHIMFKVQLTNEFRKYNIPEKDTDYSEIFVDLCYLEYTQGERTGWLVRLGRQNMIRGRGFILFEGSPLDGSRSIYFNALSTTYRTESASFEIFGISNPARDQYFPRISDADKPLIEWDESALGAYFTMKMQEKSQLDAYYMFKTQEDESSATEEARNRRSRDTHIAGIRLDMVYPSLWRIEGELAGQTGETDCGCDVYGVAGYATVTRSFDMDSKPYILAELAAFSGDDPDTTDKDEGWNPPFSRWPEWSDLYIYSLAVEKGVAYWSNMYWAKIETAFRPWKPVKLRFTYMHMEALESMEGVSSLYGSGKNRGDNFQVRTDINILDGLTGHVLYEHYLPGNYYAGDDPAYFFRMELNYKFSHSVLF